ncbi:uncharacterized protein EKO05_0000687 [Ascochyta rabiei]|uniref:Uncharacterized protein n=1 Tax=Didymella rabiei TaxID=5454 RepID=A0A162VUZ1_DIDRA|nr:uncharacterized protein EKO05_0000687 [Ascochyta rabiei]KZM18627.1 hypothetical protein ST47_g10253 [Ascochyta rabiei]UPX10011.1 hypothetical protein EKO05_0000687 [Ascochyta rabiei]
MSAWPSPTASPSQAKSLRLLRALLREASYLPDAAARDYFRRYAVARFRAYQPADHATASFDVLALAKHRHRAFKRRHLAVIRARTAQQQRQAHKGLNLLRRANQGEGPCLEKVLWFTYGRLGRRKHALLHDLLKPDPAWPEAPPPLQLLYHSTAPCLQYFEAPAAHGTHGTHTIAISKQYPRLRAVLASQSHNALALGRAIKRPYFKAPIRNTWERPMPLERAVNNVRRWYAETMTRLLPALPAAEWDSIHAMSTGKQRIAFARRRTPATLVDLPRALADEDDLPKRLQRNLALDKLSKADRPAGIDRPHALTARYMQRLYAKLLTLSCKLEYDAVHKQWNAIWGEPMKSIRPVSYTAPVDHVLFADVDAKGLRPKAHQTKANTRPLVQPRTEDGDYMRFPFFAEMLPATHPMRIDLDKWKKERAEAHASWVASGGDA